LNKLNLSGWKGYQIIYLITRFLFSPLLVIGISLLLHIPLHMLFCAACRVCVFILSVLFFRFIG
jgi:hypothetical protein